MSERTGRLTEIIQALKFVGYRWTVVSVFTLLVVAGLLTPGIAYANETYNYDDFHVVGRGERLADIAIQHNVGVDELIAVNNIVDANIIVPGQRLILPGSSIANPYGVRADSAQLPAGNGYYTVQRGDSLSLIAYNFDMSIDDLMRLNGLADPRHVWVGQQLRVTARAEPVLATNMAEAQPANAIHVVRVGDSLSEIAEYYNTTTEELLVANGLPNANFVFIGQRLRVPDSSGTEKTIAVAGAPADGVHRIEIDLSDQTLSAYQGDLRVMHTTVSTGKANTPTVVGSFQIGTKYESQHMWGDDYDLPNVPWVMYFYSGYAIHGAYWHTNFGTPASHGCVNMRPEEAEILFRWAEPGTQVVVYE